MKTIKTALFSILIVSIAIGCSKGKTSFLPNSTGVPYEVLVVIDNGLWKSPAGRALYDALDSDIPGLPQSEANFRISSVIPSQFDNILKPVRNILIVKQEDYYTMPKFTFEKDLYADGQMILYLQAPKDNQQLLEFINTNKQVMIDFFSNAEILRTVKSLEKTHNKDAQDKLLAQMGIDVCIPSALTKMKQGKDFFWVSNGEYRARLDFVAYSIPYTNAAQFTYEGMIATRDSVMKSNIPGAPEGSYMTTQKLFPPEFRALNLNKRYCGELRGLWEVKGDIMGGPFVSHTRLDEANQRLITVEVFVYAPEKEKRNLLRRLEATLYTLKLPQDNQLPEIEILPAK